MRGLSADSSRCQSSVESPSAGPEPNDLTPGANPLAQRYTIRARLCQRFQRQQPRQQKATHVRRQKQPLGKPSDGPERSMVVEDVTYSRPTGFSSEVMVVIEPRKCSSNHTVSTVSWAIECRDTTRQFLANAKVARAPRYLIPELEEA